MSVSPETALSLAGPLAGVPCCQGLPEREGMGPPLEKELADGTVLDGRFVVREAIGRSGMATIYRAEDRQQGGASVAVKVPLSRVEGDPALFARFEREERVGSGFSHPLLLRFLQVPQPRSRPYFATEFVDGCTLALVIHRSAPIPEKDALAIAAHICDALEPMHASGFVHRDLKPANLMVRRNGFLCLIDFGLAAKSEASSGLLSGLIAPLGTPEYMAPEQVRNRANDCRTDIYSLGVILYQMLVGQLPFRHEDPWEASQMRVTGDPAAPRSLNPALSLPAEEIVLRAMRRDPAERYPDVASMRRDLLDPGRVTVTGLASRLRAPRFRLSLYGTPVLAGVVIGVVSIGLMVGLFLLLARHR
jgi:serine/threonine protein kinase